MTKLDEDTINAFLSGFWHFVEGQKDYPNPFDPDAEPWDFAAWYEGYDAAYSLEQRYGVD
jgi:hypothetical protein